MVAQMAGTNGMNGSTPHAQLPPPPGVPQGMTPETPIAYAQPIAITPATIKWVFAGVISVLALMPEGAIDRYLKPARDSDFQGLRSVVEVMQKDQQQNREAIQRLTVAVDNLSGIVAELRRAPAAVVRPVVPKAR